MKITSVPLLLFLLKVVEKFREGFSGLFHSSVSKWASPPCLLAVGPASYLHCAFQHSFLYTLPPSSLCVEKLEATINKLKFSHTLDMPFQTLGKRIGLLTDNVLQRVIELGAEFAQLRGLSESQICFS